MSGRAAWRNRLAAAAIAAATALCAAPGSAAEGFEFSGQVGLEGRLFPQDSLYPGQERGSLSPEVELELRYQWKRGDRFTFKPFFRYDSTDARRTHFDLREAMFLLMTPGDLELRFGVGKVFWGVAESVHLVDIINQTDLIENPDTEEKLGQPMVMLTVPRDWGTLDLFFLPYFRERTFPGRGGRLRSAIVVDTDRPLFESGQRNHHPDFAARYAHSIGKLDVGLAYFHGTSRDPNLVFALKPDGTPSLRPFYPLIDQWSATGQYTTGPWLLKFEGLYRRGQPDLTFRRNDYFATVAGFEYTIFSAFGTRGDLGLLAEFLYDQRGHRALTPFQKDLFLGLRWSNNDAQDLTVLAGVVQDLDNRATRALLVEASRRLSGQWKLEFEARFFSGLSSSDVMYDMRRDDYLQLKLIFNF